MTSGLTWLHIPWHYVSKLSQSLIHTQRSKVSFISWKRCDDNGILSKRPGMCSTLNHACQACFGETPSLIYYRDNSTMACFTDTSLGSCQIKGKYCQPGHNHRISRKHIYLLVVSHKKFDYYCSSWSHDTCKHHSENGMVKKKETATWLDGRNNSRKYDLA